MKEPIWRRKAIYGISINKNVAQSQTGQLIAQLRDAILDNKIKCGEKLPPTRSLAKELHIARNCVIQAYEQLLAEGYLESRMGSGTFVADFALQDFIVPKPKLPVSLPTQALKSSPVRKIDFNPGMPDLKLFPRQTWAKILKNTILNASDTIWGYGSVAGELSLRQSILDYLYRSKGLTGTIDQLTIVSGIAQANALLARLFYKPGNSIVMEDPCDNYTRNIFIQNSLRIIPVPVDQNGICPELLPDNLEAKLVYLVPSHQFPIGGVLPLGRRLELISYARTKDAYIIEDDYDSEFRFAGEPIQPLQQLAPDRVIYLGTFSKTFAPGIRLGFMLLPIELVSQVNQLKEELNLRTPSLIQLAMAQYLDSKDYDKHLYKMKKFYESKRNLLIDTLHKTLSNKIKINGTAAGMHLLVEFADHSFTTADIEDLERAGVIVDWVEDYAICKGKHDNQLVLGYGGLTKEDIESGVELLGKTLLSQI